MPTLTLPKPPEEVLLDFHRIARRWNSHRVVVEERLKRAGIEIVEIAQKPKHGCRLSDLLSYEAKMRREQKCKEKAPVLQVVK